MILGTDTKRILTLCLPIIGGMMSQNILNLVDTLMIGQLGALALAAAGIGGFLFFTSFSAFTGIEIAVQTMVARYKGENRPTLYEVPFFLGLFSALALGTMLAVAGICFADVLVGFFSTDVNVLVMAEQYYSYRIWGLPFLCGCLVVRGFFNGLSRPMRYLKVVIIMHGLNIGLNYVLIYGHFGFPAMGAQGAGLASSLSVFVGALMYAFDCRKFIRFKQFLSHARSVIVDNSQWLIRLSGPAAIQQFLFALGVSMFFWILSLLGTEAIAIGNVLINIVLVGILPGVGLGVATMSLVSESLGEKQYKQAFLWPFKVTKVAVVLLGPLFLFAIIYPQVLIKPFISDPLILAQAIWPLRLDCMGVFIEVGTLIFMNALNGADRTRYVMWVTIVCQWLIYLPLSYYVGITLGVGMIGVWAMWIVFQVLQVTCFAGYWLKYRSDTVQYTP